jgi:hypothetical protein
MGTVPEQKETRLIAKLVGEWEDECFRFIDEGIEATNNLSGADDTAERTGPCGIVVLFVKTCLFAFRLILMIHRLRRKATNYTD